MPFPLDTAHVDASYAVRTRRRIAHVISELQATLRYGTGDIEGMMFQIRQQEEASRRAKFDHIVTLCRAIADGVAEIRGSERPRIFVATSTLLDTCRTIGVHADSIARSLRRDGKHDYSERKDHATQQMARSSQVR